MKFLIAFLIATQTAWAAPKISLDLSYKSVSDDSATKNGIVKEGERMEAHYKRGDIDTYISMSPRYEIKEGKKLILIDLEIQNMRDGDLISESNAQISTLPGQKAQMTFNDEQLEDELTLSVTPQSL